MANTPKVSLQPHSLYPSLPAQATNIKGVSGCLDCPLYMADGHKTCSSFKVENNPVVTNDNRIDLNRMREMQTQVHLRSFITDGVAGGSNGVYVDSWYRWNAKNQYNFANFSSWKIISISGNTIQLETFDGADARTVLHSFWREKDSVLNYFWVNGYADYTSIQPLDIVEAQYPSLAAYKLIAKVVKVTNCTDTQITLELDKAFDCALTVSPEYDTETLPEPVLSVKIYHYGREAEHYNAYIQEPIYFLGKRVQKVLAIADVPSDGIWILEDSLPIASPDDSVDPLNSPNFVIEGFQDGVGFVTINENNRLHISPNNAVYSLKTTLPSGSLRDSLSSDLTATYSIFRCTYYVATDVTDSSCSVRGYYCFNSKVDHTESVGNYGTVYGAGITAENKHVYCGERIYETFTPIDNYNRIEKESVPPASGDGIEDIVEVELHFASGIQQYPNTTGKCIQYGYCDKYKAVVPNLGANDAPFNIDYKVGPFFKDIWFAADKRLHQIQAPYQYYQTERVQSPSILYLNGYYASLTSMQGYHSLDTFRNEGAWSTKEPTIVSATYDEGLSTQYTIHTLVNPSGFERGYIYNPDGSPQLDTTRGNIPSTIPSFVTKRNPVDYTGTVDNDVLTLVGGLCERDSGLLSGRGLSNSSHSIAPQDIICPNVDLTSNDLQQGEQANFLKQPDKAIIYIQPLRQPLKGANNIGSRVISSVQGLGNNRYLLEFENTTKTFSRLNIGDVGVFFDSFDELFTVSAGGGPCILPYENQVVNSYHNPYKQYGSRMAAAWSGDSLAIEGTSKRFLIESVEPHGGSEAPTWGNRTLRNDALFNVGYYEKSLAEDLLPIEIIYVKDFNTGVFFTVNTEETRPDVIEENECWFNGYNIIVFGNANANDYIEIKFTDQAEVPEGEVAIEYIEHFYIEQYKYIDINTDYSEYSTADTKKLYIDADEAVIITSGNPSVGQLKVEELSGSGKIRIHYNVDDCFKQFRMVLTFDVESPAPQNDWCLGGNYLSFAKKRDIAIVVDDSGYFDSNAVVGSSVDFIQSATVFKPKTSYIVQWTEYQSDNWQTIPSEFVNVNAASGEIEISNGFFEAFENPYGYGYSYGYSYGYESDYFDVFGTETDNEYGYGYGFDIGTGLSGVLCFKIKDIELFDHRSHVSDELWNATQDTIDGLTWCYTPMISGGGASFGYAAGGSKDQDYCSDVPNETFAVGTPNGNYMFRTSGGGDFHSVAQASAGASVETSGISFPYALATLPDGVEIVQAKALVSAANLTRTYTWYDTVAREGDTETSIEGIGFVLMAVTGPNSAYAIGSLPSTGTGNGNFVLDFTGVIQTMWNLRNSSSVYGYIVMPDPSGIGTGGIEEWVKNNISLPPMGPFDLNDDGEIEPDPGYCTPGGPTMATSWEGHTTLFFFTEDITWSSINIQQMALLIDFNDVDKKPLVSPRFPNMSNSIS